MPKPIELVADAYDAYARGDAEPFFNLVAEEGVIRFAAPPGAFAFAGPFTGPDGARQAIAAIANEFQWLTYANHELIGDGDLVVGIGGGRLRHLASGRETALTLADLFRFENGRAVEFVEFFDTAGLADWRGGGAPPATAMMNPEKRAGVLPPEDADRNKVLLANAYMAYADLDAEPLMSALAEDITYNSVAREADFRFASPCFGRDAFLGNLQRIADEYQLKRFDVVDIAAGGDLVAVHADVAFEERDTGRLAEAEKLDVFRMFNGRVTEFNEFFDTLKARRENR